MADYLSTTAAAQRLGVSRRTVQRRAQSGEVQALAPGLLDARSVLGVEPGPRKRVWSEQTAWAAAAILSGVRPDWIGPAQRSRVAARLRTDTPTALVSRTRGRATVSRWHGHPATVARLRGDIVDTGAARIRLGLADSSRADGYLSAKDLAGLVDAYALTPDPGGVVTLRATTFDLDTVRNLAAASDVLVALDLAGSSDVRERTTGLQALRAALAGLRSG